MTNGVVFAEGEREREGKRAEEVVVPPRGVKKGTKRARQYEHVKESELDQGRSESRAEEIAARTVNKERARAGESRERSKTSTRDISSGRRGGLRSGTNRTKGRTRDQLYAEAKRMGIDGRSNISSGKNSRTRIARRPSSTAKNLIALMRKQTPAPVKP